MLGGFTPKLGDAIVSALLERGSLSAKELHRIVSVKLKKKITLQAVYVELGNLVSGGIIIRSAQLYAPKIVWLVEMLATFSSAYNRFIAADSSDDLLPAPRRRRSYKFRALTPLVSFWSQVNLRILPLSADRTYYDSVPFIWYHFVNAPIEKQWLESLARLQMRYVLISQHDSWIDRTYQSFPVPGLHEVYFGRRGLWGSADDQQYDHFGVVGDYVMEVKFPNTLLATLTALYDLPKQKSTSALMSIATELQQPNDFGFSIHHSKHRARQIRKRFCEFLDRSVPRPVR